MIKSVTINVDGIETVVEIPFGYIPVDDGPLFIGDKAYKIYDNEWQEIHVNESRYDKAEDYYLVIRPTVQ